MKKAILLILTVVFTTFTSCNQQTLESYNNTIVSAHKKLLDTNDAFYGNSENFIGNQTSKKDLLELIKKTKEKLIEDKKPVEALVPFTDHGMRKTMLEMYAATEDSMDFLAAHVDFITDPENTTKTVQLFQGEYSKIKELDALIRELQVQYAYYNKGQLR